MLAGFSWWGPRVRACFAALAWAFLTLSAPSPAVAQDMDALHTEILSHLQRGEIDTAREKIQKYLSWLKENAGETDIRFSDAFNDNAVLAMMTGDLAEAESSAKRALEIAERADPPDERRYAAAVATLAGIYGMQGRTDEARALSARSTELFGKTGPDEEDLFASLARVANLDAGDPVQFVEVEATHKKAIAYFERNLPENDRALIGMVTALASLYVLHKRCADAEPLLARAARAQEQNPDFGPFERATTNQSIADCLAQRGAIAEADVAYGKVLDFYEGYFGKDSVFAAITLVGMAKGAMQTGRPAEALGLARRVAAIQLRQLSTETVDARSRARSDTGRFAFDLVMEAAWAAAAKTADRPALLAEAFQAAQLSGRTRAGDAFGQLNARLEAGTGDIATRIRATQDLRSKWQAADRELVQLMIAGADAARFGEVRTRMADLEQEIAASETALAKLSPSYSALIGLETLTPDDVAKLLKPDEILLVPSANENETFFWFLTPSENRWLRSDMTTKSLGEHVAALRCGLDHASWNGAGRDRCASLLSLPAGTPMPKPLPFDAGKAYEIYKTLFTGAEDLLRSENGTWKHLMIVPSGPLAQLPFQTLVTEPPADGAKPSWLMRRHAITVLPSVASLKALRSHPRPASSDRRIYAAFANPLIAGNETSEEDRAGASVATLMTDCATTAKVRPFLPETGNYMGNVGGVAAARSDLWLETLRRWRPVPQTAVLACEVAKAMNAGEDDIYLGPRATETNVKAMSASGALANYAVVNFATHGAIAGEVAPNAEPGLVLTPPDAASEENDGYLSAAEVAALKLDADWVILSACNTAASNAKEAEALSGLARAFFYAGARTMLVSHWSVREDAAVALMVHALSATAVDRSLGRAEAMRRAMTALADSGNTVLAHPAYWAPFVVVGEGN
ncbi:CHAT domain-containing tetratricopeptide repeat protein [uncultured Hyphomicrobium sp.]|uniref:CHAT domain-containing protein n=1 Tax=uncultured Hyphomicrobium sp. TaxID=194373 RepID=UPI0025D07679|nr:CHAT domain-containing tetratricopeptide repeat protein [uncultured Hyphomicrobium sp.]